MARAERPSPTASTLLLDESFAAGDERFLAELLASRAARKLKSLAGPWYADARPWARAQLLAYVADGGDRPGHRPLVKSLFKAAEAAGDDELMGLFMVAFDRLARRQLVERHSWDWRNRRRISETVLRSDSEVPSTPARAKKLDRFSRPTRLYLARRAFRYFRRLGWHDPGRYGRAVRAALVRYEDASLTTPAAILDAWGLVHVLWHGSPVLDRRPRGIVLAAGASLAELMPAPCHPAAWRDCRDGLLALAAQARARTVRAWAIALLERDYASELSALDIAVLRPLLASQHEEVQVFAARLLRSAQGLADLPLEEWFSLLRLDNLVVLPVVVALAERHLTADRLSLADCVGLASVRPAPVAELGWRFVRERTDPAAPDIDQLLPLTAAQAPAVRLAAAVWLASLLRTAPQATALHVRHLLDARFAEPRGQALALMATELRFASEPLLWEAALESPYPDVREILVRNLAACADLFAVGSLRQLWASLLLAVHRGGAAKRQAVGQIAERLVAEPARADELLPLLAIALRSLRPSERRSALAAVTRLAWRRPDLRLLIGRHLPELALFAEEVA